MQDWLNKVRCFLIALTCAVLAEPTGANPVDWVLLEARLVPQSCSKPLECIPKSSLIVRNLAFMQQDETREITLFLNRIATIRGISDATKNALNHSRPLLVPRFHEQAKTGKEALLRDHPGVYFESTKLDSDPETKALSDFVRTSLLAAGVKFLTKEEMEATPGRPQLSIRYSRHRESEGCIIPFSLSMSISEEVVLVRAPDLKTTTSIWSGSIRENLANRNYKLSSGIRELVEKFLVDWTNAQV